jgi:hypothetical protein
MERNLRGRRAGDRTQSRRRPFIASCAAVDVVLVTPEDFFERYGDSPCLAIHPALRERKVVYGAQISVRDSAVSWASRELQIPAR